MKKRVLFVMSTLLLVLVLAACGGATGSTSPSGSRTPVQVTETDFKIASSVRTFTPGTSYHFVVTNNGQTVHEFMIMPKAEGSMSDMPMSHMDSMALAKVDNIASGQTKTLDYTFPSSTAGSRPQFACYYPGHYEAGMGLDVTVNS
jgi:uncharacterized cupredoxin-like copper-binding protein